MTQACVTDRNRSTEYFRDGSRQPEMDMPNRYGLRPWEPTIAAGPRNSGRYYSDTEAAGGGERSRWVWATSAR